MMTNRIIFQDIDGPLIPLRMYFGGGRPFDPNVGSFIYDPIAVAMIVNLCNRFQAKVVINSAHGENPQSVLKAQANYNGLSSVIHEDVSTIFPNATNRLSAIEEWLSRHPEIKEWIVIDDMPVDSNRSILHTRQVPIDYNIGMTMDSYIYACELFGEKISPIIGIGQNNYYSYRK